MPLIDTLSHETQIMESLQEISPFSVHVLTPTDAEAYRSVRLRALHEQPPALELNAWRKVQ
ncbi:MAG: hypothetical protein F6K19_27690 [Cyanothece sp. SIO1E1]|nr:hypothetical protein [Cyanothece sp. SIO1E1]